MSTFIPFSRDQALLLPPDLKAWVPDDDLAHFVVAAVERVPIGAFRTGAQLRGIRNAATEWTLIALAYNCRPMHRLQPV